MTLKLYVGNLNASADEASLQTMFAPFGEVKSARIAIDRETRTSRGFGFVRMASEQSSQDAIAGLNGKDVNGQSLTVKTARTREERQRRNGAQET